MTWSLSNTVTWSSSTAIADHRSAWTYFFDTFLHGVSTFTTSAWPATVTDGNIYRKLKLTMTNTYTNAAYNMYYNVRLTDDELELFIDALYTTNPQDSSSLGTALQQNRDFNLANPVYSTSTNPTGYNYPDGSSTNFGDYKFWTSSENTDARLLTKGRRILFYWPGWTSGFFYEDSTWNGSTSNNGMHVFGILWSDGTAGSGPGRLVAKPSPHTGANIEGEFLYEIPRAQNTADKPTTDYSTTQKSVLFTGWSTGGVNEDFPTFPPVTEPDVAIFSPYEENGEEEWFSNSEGTLVRVNNGNYWLIGADDEFKEALAFDFGTVEPLF